MLTTRVHHRDQSVLTYLMVCGSAGALTIGSLRKIPLFSGCSLYRSQVDIQELRAVEAHLFALRTSYRAANHLVRREGNVAGLQKHGADQAVGLGVGEPAGVAFALAPGVSVGVLAPRWVAGAVGVGLAGVGVGDGGCEYCE